MISIALSEEKNWKLRSLLLCHLLIASLLGSLLWEPTAALWHSLDLHFFKWINHSLEGRKGWQLFWALANHKRHDLVVDFCILIFFSLYIYYLPKGERIRGIFNLLFITLYIAAIIYFVNRLFFREYCIIYRDSPSLVVDHSIRLSQEIPWLHTKEVSYKSFPGDHGTTAILFAGAFAYLARLPLGAYACFYGVFLCMPRLISGAHWLSDVIVGSGSMALFFLSWAFCTPLRNKFCNSLCKLIGEK